MNAKSALDLGGSLPAGANLSSFKNFLSEDHLEENGI